MGKPAFIERKLINNISSFEAVLRKTGSYYYSKCCGWSLFTGLYGSRWS